MSFRHVLSYSRKRAEEIRSAVANVTGVNNVNLKNLRTGGEMLDSHWMRHALCACTSFTSSRLVEWGVYTREVQLKSVSVPKFAVFSVDWECHRHNVVPSEDSDAWP